jgi:D-alanyl-D-alanine carboxypeptidase
VSSLRELDPRLAPYALAFVDALRAAGLVVVVTSVVRSQAKQRRLYNAYLARGKTGLPALPPGHSLHEHGLAWDMVVKPEEYQPIVGQLWKRYGGQWGGDAKIGYDPVHFQAKQLL